MIHSMPKSRFSYVKKSLSFVVIKLFKVTCHALLELPENIIGLHVLMEPIESS